MSAIDPTAFIHPKAHIEGSQVGARTRVWQFASVIRGTVLGEDCNVAHGACLDGPRFGDRCIIGHNVAMGPGFEIGDDVFIGPGVVFCNDMWPSTHKEGWDIKRFQDGFVTIKIEAGAIIGANAVILPGVMIGAGAVVAAGATCAESVPAGWLWGRAGQINPLPDASLRVRMHPVKPPGRWRFQTNPNEATPIGDLREHTAGELCWCKPFWTEGVLAHNSLDRREVFERGKLKRC